MFRSVSSFLVPKKWHASVITEGLTVGNVVEIIYLCTNSSVSMLMHKMCV